MPRVAKGDAKPRGRMTAYAYFVQICREEHKKKHPEENVVFAEFSKKCAERWKVSGFALINFDLEYSTCYACRNLFMYVDQTTIYIFYNSLHIFCVFIIFNHFIQ